MFKKSLHRRNDSGELDVFEAAKYFSGHANEIYGYTNSSSGNFSSQMINNNNGRDHHQEKRRLSLDVPMLRNAISTQTAVLVMDHQKKQTTKEKKHKQPSSPGGRLASFLNSLFNQKSISSSRKKKSSSSSNSKYSMKDDNELLDDESPAGGWRRKRRSSISHFRSTTTTADAKSLYSSSSSGFRTPPPYAQTTAPTPNKSYKDLNQLHLMALISKPTNGFVHSDDDHRHNSITNIKNDSDYTWLDEKLGFINTSEHTESYYKQHRNNINALIPDKKIQSNWPADRYLSTTSEEKEFKKFNVDGDDDGADSDSSSDLFELPNYDLGCFSSGLPVYETTNMDNIKKSTPISTATR